MSSSVNLVRSLVRVPVRRLHSSGGARWFSSGGFSAVNADEGKLGTKFYHAINLAILAGVPIAIASSPSSLTMPLDVALGLALPLHGHIGMNYVITDYVPKSYRGPARAAMLAASVLAAVGLLKLNLTGAGLTETLKATWIGPRKKSPEDAQTTQKTA